MNKYEKQRKNISGSDPDYVTYEKADGLDDEIYIK